MKYYKFSALLHNGQWMRPAFVGIDASGSIACLSEQQPGDNSYETIDGAVLPGFQNAHSHAFQYGMAGMAEQHAENAQDDFWSWREAMYECALGFGPDDMYRVGLAVYKAMLRNGYTHVAEFHYVHHQKDGRPYSNLAEMGAQLVAAAKEAGIRITLVPVFYQKGNFGTHPYPRQRRFISPTIDDYFQLLDASAAVVKGEAHASLGFGVHSLRAVEAADILATYAQGPKDLPFHLHAAEQLKEIADCQAYLGSRPIEWLLQNLPVNERFHLVHCTHMTDAETQDLAASGGNAVLCPGTEGNLGDGIFRMTDYKNAGGSWSIGTDSHISLNPLEDLRWLDYAQRFTTHRRNTWSNGAKAMVQTAWQAGRKAVGMDSTSTFAIGSPFDAVVYDMQQPLLAQAAGTLHLLPAIVYTAGPAEVLGTLVGGEWKYRRG